MLDNNVNLNLYKVFYIDPIQIINRLETSLYNEINNRNQLNKIFVKVLV